MFLICLRIPTTNLSSLLIDGLILLSLLDFIDSYVKIYEPWILLTNGDVMRAIKDYHYCFGAIEFLFKDQKSNGFDLQKSNNSFRSLQSYSMMYTYMCICILFLSCVGTYYTRHKGKYYKDVKIRYYGVVKGKRRR